MGNVDWIDLRLYRDKWRALVNSVVTIWFHKVRDSLGGRTQQQSSRGRKIGRQSEHFI